MDSRILCWMDSCSNIYFPWNLALEMAMTPQEREIIRAAKRFAKYHIEFPVTATIELLDAVEALLPKKKVKS